MVRIYGRDTHTHTHAHTHTLLHTTQQLKSEINLCIYTEGYLLNITVKNRKQVAQHMCNITPCYLLKLEVYTHHTSVHITVFKNYHLH